MAKGKRGEFVRSRRAKTRSGGGAVRPRQLPQSRVIKARGIRQRYMDGAREKGKVARNLGEALFYCDVPLEKALQIYADVMALMKVPGNVKKNAMEALQREYLPLYKKK